MNRLTKITMLLSFVFILALSTGCGKEKNVVAQDQTNEVVTIVHDLGQAVFETKPEKVIVFDYATLDTLRQMDIEVSGVVQGNMPSYLEEYESDSYENIGTLFEPDFERIYEMAPDVIFISGRQAEVYEELDEIAPTVYLSIDTSDYLGSLEKNMGILGQIFDQEPFVEEALVTIKTEMDALVATVKANGENALVIMANDGALSAYGPGSRFGVVHKEFAYPPADPNIEASNHGQSISFEYILDIDPDIIFVIDRGAVTGGSNAAQATLDNEVIHMTKAYQTDNIRYLNAYVWYVASGGYESSLKMIEEMQ